MAIYIFKQRDLTTQMLTNIICQLQFYLQIFIISLINITLQHHSSSFQMDRTIQKTQLEQCIQAFGELKAQGILPPKMQMKLEILLKSIRNQQINENTYEQVPNYQQVSLIQISLPIKIQLFCSIVNCLSGTEIITYLTNQKIYLIQNSLFKFWSQCYLNIDTNSLTINKSDQKLIIQVEINTIKISKSYKDYKKKTVFGVYSNNEEILLGFDNENICKKVYSTLEQLIRSKKHKTNKQKIYSKQVAATEQLTSNLIQIEQNQQLLDQDYNKIRKQFATIDFNDHTSYQLLQNFDIGRVMIHQTNKKILKYIILIPTHNPQLVLQLYIKFNQWNPEIEISQIKSKVSTNSYLFYLKFRKYSLMSYQRDALVVVTAFKINNRKYYLDILSINDNDINDSKCLRSDFKQRIEVNVGNNDHTLMTIISENNFYGYNTDQDNRNMTINILKNLQYFPKYVISNQILQTKNLIFNFNKVKFKKIYLKQQEQSQNNTLPTAQNQCHQDQNLKQVLSIKQKQDSFAELLQISLSKHQIKANQNLVILIKANKYQNYQLNHKFDQNSYINQTRFQHSRQPQNDFVLQNGDWRINQQGDLVYQNQQSLKMQKGVIKYILKQIGSNLINGKSVMNMSLPVEIFDSVSMLQRLAMVFGYIAKYLVDASLQTDKVQQMKKVILYVISCSLLYLNTGKPFNPTIGETFSCRIGGIPLYLEQTSHHPPICSFYMKSNDFEYFGNYHADIEMGLNSCYAMNYKTQFLNIFKTNTKYQIKSPDLQIIGLIYGDRKYRPHGKIFIHEATNNTFCECSMGKIKKGIYQSKNKIKPQSYYGGIYKVKDAFSKKFKNYEKKYKFDGLNITDFEEKYTQIEGLWADNIYMDGKVVRQINSPLPNRIEHQKYVLPSDSNLRLDLIYKRIGDLAKSTQQKQILENTQRRYRKLRQARKKK